MPLPFDVSGEMSVRSARPPTDAINVLVRGLRGLRVQHVERDDLRIEFATRASSIYRMRFLRVIDSGELLLKPLAGGFTVWYRLNLRRLFWFLTGALLIGFAPPLVMAPNVGAVEALGILLAIWVTMFGVNVSGAVFGFRRWIRAAIAGKFPDEHV